MRPPLLDPLFAPVATLPASDRRTSSSSTGCSAATARRARSTCCSTCPTPRSTGAAPKIRDAAPDQIATIEVKVADHRAAEPALHGALQSPRRGRHRRCRARLLSRQCSIGCRRRCRSAQTRWVSGKLELWDGHLPDGPSRSRDGRGGARPAPAGRTRLWPDRRAYIRTVTRAAKARCNACRGFPEWIARRHAESAERAGLRRGAHNVAPPEAGRRRSRRPAATRLGFDELLANQLALLFVQGAHARAPGPQQRREGRLARQSRGRPALPLTGSQG